MLFALLEEAGTGCSMSQCSTTLPSESTRKISIPAVSWLLHSKYSNTPFALGLAMPLVHWAMPSRYHSIHKNDLARAMVAQSEQAFLALAQGKGPAAPAVKILEYKEMELFFVAGDSDAP